MSPDARADAAMVATAPARPRFWNVPNTLTVGRLVLAAVVFALIAFDRYALALAAFVVAALSDALDGYFARLLKQDTPIGRQLDPLIDKVIVSGCYIYLAAIPGTGVLPWMVTAIVVRELLIQGLRSLLEGQGQPFGAKMAGKLKTTVQCCSISAVLLALAVSAPPVVAPLGPRHPDLAGGGPDHLQRGQLPRRRDARAPQPGDEGLIDMEWLESLVLGVVQGITEFLPVSSDGHLAITQQAFAWLTGHSRSGQENLFFDIMLHAGTLAAILFYFRAVIVEGARGFLLGAGDVRPGLDRASVVRAGLLAAVATSPLVPFALFFKKRLEETFQSSQAAGVGFLITAAVLLLVSVRLKGPEGGKGLAQTTWVDALLIGIAQMFAPLPGVSRSGLTIAAALALGLSRTWSVGFSLLIAVPAICGAVVFELKDVIKDHRRWA